MMMRLFNFLSDLIDNDTLIIAGVLALAFSTNDAEIRKQVLIGLFAFMGIKGKKS